MRTKGNRKLWTTSRKVKGGKICTWRRGRATLYKCILLDGWVFCHDAPIKDGEGTIWFMCANLDGPQFVRFPQHGGMWYE